MECIHEAFGECAKKNPDAVAIVCENQHITYKKLDQKSHILARWLQYSCNIKIGESVAIFLEKSIDLAIAILSVCKIGGICIPLNPTAPLAFIAKILRESKSKWCITSHKLSNRISFVLEVVFIEDVRKHIKKHELISFSSINLALVIYTSGSTTAPKGVAISHRNFISRIKTFEDAYGFSSADIFICRHSPSFIMAIVELFGCLFSGGKTIIQIDVEKAGVEGYCRLLKRERVTFSFLLPNEFLEICKVFNVSKSGLRGVLLGGAPLSTKIKSEIDVFNSYGLSETTGGLASCLINENDINDIGTCLKFDDVKILDDNLCESDYGEIFVSGNGLANGYFRNPKLTAEKFIANPFGNGSRMYRTGDIGTISSGKMKCVGRTDNQVKIRGFRVETESVEKFLAAIAEITDCSVVAKNIDEDKQLVAYIVLKNNQISEQITVRNIREQLKNALPSYMVPSSFIVLSSIPRTENGKVDRNLLISLNIFDTRAQEYIAPKSYEEEQVCGILERVLGISHIGINDDFFDIGGSSLCAVKAINLINGVLSSNLQVEDFFELRTVSKIAEKAKKTLGQGRYQKYLISCSDDKHLFDPFEMSNMQKAYNIGRNCALPLGGVSTHLYFEYKFASLDIKRLEQSLNILIERHHTLRSIFKNNKQIFLKNVNRYKIRIYELKSFEELEKLRNKYSHKIYTVSHYPLFDIFVSKFTEKMVLHVSVDALLMDVSSFFLFMDEWTHLYIAPRTKLPKLDVTFRDYMQRYNEVLRSQSAKQAKDYWKKVITEYKVGMNLPYIVEPKSVKNPHFRRIKKIIDKTTWTKVVKKCNGAGVSSTDFLLMIYGEVLKYWTSQSSVIINLTLFNRLPLHPHVNNILGDFTSVELFNYKEKHGSIASMLRSVHQQLWNDLNNSLTDGNEVQRLIRKRNNIPNDILIAPIVLTSISDKVIENVLDDSFEKELFSISQTSQVCIDEKAYKSTEGFVIEWDYVENLFDKITISEMHSMYCDLIGQLTGLDWNNCEFPTLSPSQSNMLLIEKANSFIQPLSKENLVSAVEKSAVKASDAIAVVCDFSKQSYTYSQLKSDIENLAAKLVARSIKDRIICVLGEKGYWQVVLTIGVMKSGHVFLPLNIDWPMERIRELLGLAKTKTILCSKDRFTKLSEEFDLIDINELMKSKSPSCSFPKIDKNEAAYVIYTSGSTGTPKGVMISHEGVLNTIQAVNQRIGDCESILSVSDLSFDLSIYDIFGCLLFGGKIVFPDQNKLKDVRYLCRLIDKYEIHVWNTVPQLANLLADEKKKNYYLKAFLISGDKIDLQLPCKLFRYFPRAHIYALGGATEGSIWSIWYEIKNIPHNWNKIPYGIAMPNQKMYVLNGQLEHCCVGVQGEIYIGGIGVSLGYLNDKNSDSESFFEHPKLGRIYKTGDIGKWNRAGYIDFIGRKNEVLKLNGNRIDLHEIEAKLNSLNGIENAIVAIQKDKKNQEHLIGYLVSKQKNYVNSNAFKLEQRGLLKTTKNYLSVPLSLDEEKYRQHKSYRHFFNDLSSIPKIFPIINKEIIPEREITQSDIFALLAAISALKLSDRIMPKFLYPSAGSTYSVRAFTRMSGYYDPVNHRLYPDVQINCGDDLNFVIHRPAIETLYGNSAVRYAYIEVGHMLALLMNIGQERNIPMSWKLVNHKLNQDDILAVTVSFSNKYQLIKSTCTVKRFIKKNNMFLCGKKKIIPTDYDVFLQAGEFGQVMKNATLLISIENKNDTELSCISAGITAQNITETLLKNSFGTCMLGPKLYAGSIYSIAAGKIDEETMRKSEDKICTQSVGEIVEEKLKYVLPGYMIPRRFCVIDKIPLNANGKIDTKELSKIEIDSNEKYAAPHTDLEKSICGVFEKILEKRVGIDDNFFKLGGDSISAIRIISKLGEQGIQTSLADIFEQKTARKLAEISKKGWNFQNFEACSSKELFNIDFSEKEKEI